MKKMLWCIHHIVIDNGGYYESVKACSSREMTEKIARSISKGKAFICLEKMKKLLDIILY